ncbi:MAG: MFS transporter [Desulfovibrionaceae bacterium]
MTTPPPSPPAEEDATTLMDDLAARRTVQQYLDEVPTWPDGTQVSSTPMTSMQWRIWALATAGKFFEGLVVFMTGVALPLMVEEFHLGAMEKGAIGAASLFGILVGATALGGLSDRYGRKKMFIAEMLLFCICLSLVAVSPNYFWLLACLFGMGLALGCDYPTAHMVISESIPSRDRGKLVLGAFGFQAVGALVGASLGYLILYRHPDIGAWRWMYATAILPALLVLIGRFFIPDSGHWLVARGRIRDAELEMQKLLARRPPYPKDIKLAAPRCNGGEEERGGAPTHYGVLFDPKNRRASILASVPWFLQDLSTYGVGIFTPTILAAAIGHKTQFAHNITALIQNDMQAAKGAAFIDVLLLCGIITAVMLADKVGRIKLQVTGFIGCAVGLFLAAMSTRTSGGSELMLIVAGFMIFNFMTNMGPNSMTYLLAGEVFPVHIRGKGAGFAASFAKIGAVCTAFLFPILLKDLGTGLLLYILAGASLLGALITWRFRIETAGVSLEDIGLD